MSHYNRRSFIGTAALGTAALIAGTSRSFGQAAGHPPIGVQLYSVRNQFQADNAATLEGVRAIGYEGVEFAGYGSFNDDAKGLRKLLNDTGLKCCGTHLQGSLRAVNADNLERTIEYNQIIGNNKLVVPSLRARTLDDWASTADTFNEIAEQLKPYGMRVGFHNHFTEFEVVDGEVQLDYFFARTNPSVFVQLDIGHCQHAGADPAAYLKKYSGRIVSVHSKDWDENSRANNVVGEGTVDWATVAPAVQAAGVEWHIVEEESGAFEGLDGIEKSYRNLVGILHNV